MITGAFLAEAASVVDNKLAVSGGVLSGFRVGRTGWPSLCLWC